MARSYLRGHVIYCNDGMNWLYIDDDSSADVERPCARCGRMPTPEGYDACIGYVEGATSACCGHGVGEPFVIMEDEKDVNNDNL